MEASKSADDAPRPVVVVPSSSGDRGAATRRQRRRRRRHLLRSSVYFVSVAALFGGVCLVIAVRNAAQVTALKQRIERLERLEEGGAAAAAAAGAGGDDASSESMYHLEAENLIWDPLEHRANMFKHRQRREAKEKNTGSGKVPKTPAAAKAKALSAIHMTLNLEEAAKRLNQQKDVVTLEYGNLTTFGFRPKKENQTYIYKPWKVSDWSHKGKDYTFKSTEGKVKIDRKGLYYIYSQILYHNSAARSSYVIMVDQGTFVKCMGSVDSISPDSSSADNARYKTCYVGAARVLEKGQHVWINDLYGHYVSPDSHANFFGLVKIVDLEK